MIHAGDVVLSESEIKMVRMHWSIQNFDEGKCLKGTPT
jgi:hypothetical protein